MSLQTLKKSTYFTILSALAAGINFLYYPVIATLLTTERFGDVQIGVSFIMLFGALFTSLGVLALYLSATKTTTSGMFHIERLMMLVSLAGAMSLIAFHQPIATALQLHNSSLLFLLAFIFLINIPAGTWVGALQGNGQFISSGWISVASATAKIIFSVIFISLGLGAHGALMGMAVGSLLILPLVLFSQTTSLVKVGQTFGIFRQSDWRYIKKHRAMLLLLVTLVGLALTSSLDIIFAKALFSPTEAGNFAKASTAAKIPLFSVLPIALILFERFIKKNINVPIAVTVYIGVVGLLSMLVYAFQRVILHSAFSFTGDGRLFTPLLTAFSTLSITYLFAYLGIALKHLRRVFIGIFAGLTCVLGGLFIASTTPLQLSYSFLAGQVVLLFLMLAVLYTMRHE
jgi:O-antigen/teichoic acid export membrane protein